MRRSTRQKANLDDQEALSIPQASSPETLEADEFRCAEKGAVAALPPSRVNQSDTLPKAKAAPDRSRQAWATIESLYARHAINLRGYLRKLVGAGPPDPDDVVQAAFEKLAKVEDLGQIKNPHAFLWRTAQNIVTSEYRSASVRSRHQESVTDVFYPQKSDGLDPERVLLARKELAAVMRAVESMPSARRTVLILSRVEGLSLAAIGRRLGISRSAAQKRLSVAMTELHKATNKD